MRKGSNMRCAGPSAKPLLSIMTLGLILFACLTMATKAHAENWFKLADKSCMDLDSFRIVQDWEHESLVVYSMDMKCEPGAKAHLSQIRGVRRDDCPDVLNGGQTVLLSVYGVGDDFSKVKPLRAEANDIGRGTALIACRHKGAPDGLVVFENDMATDSVVVYVDGGQACRIESMGLDSDCDVDLRRYGSDVERRHAIRIVAGGRSVNDTVSISDCHWNWRGTKVFKIEDARVHFDCM